MIGRYVLPLLALIGLTIAVGAVIQGNQTAPLAPPVVQSPEVPFAAYVAGAGMIEASTENIAIGTPVSGVVAAIYVTWGDRVNAGKPLFKIDDRDLQGQLLIAVAKVKEAEANLAKTKNLLRVAEGLRIGSSISAVDLANRRFDAAINEAALALAVEGVASAVPLALGTAEARFPKGRFQSFQVIGVDDATLSGVPALAVHLMPRSSMRAAPRASLKRRFWRSANGPVSRTSMRRHACWTLVTNYWSMTIESRLPEGRRPYLVGRRDHCFTPHSPTPPGFCYQNGGG